MKLLSQTISYKSLLLLTLVTLLTVACSKEDSPAPQVPDTPDPEPTSKDVTAHDFMWKAMNLWYFWQADVADLSDSRFSTDKSYNDYLQARRTRCILQR